MTEAAVLSADAVLTMAPKPRGKPEKQKRPAGTGSVFFRGRMAWIAYRHNGEQVCESTHQTDEHVAAKILRERLRTTDTPAHVTAKAERVTFDEVAALYVADYVQKRNRTLKKAKECVRALRDVFGGPWLSVTEPRIERFKAECLDRHEQPATINRRLAALRRMGNLAVRLKLVPSRPHVALLDESENVREGFVEPADFKVLLSHLPADIADGTEFAYCSAWRRAMVFEHTVWPYVTLKWSEDRQTITGGVIRLPGKVVKNKKPATLVLKGRLLDIVQRRWTKRLPGCPYVFHRDGRRIRGFRAAWETACEAAGLPGLLFHDLRRSAVRNLRRAGETDHTIMKMATMKTPSIFKRYDIVDESDIERAAENYSAWLAVQEQQPRRQGSLSAARAKRAAAAL